MKKILLLQIAAIFWSTPALASPEPTAHVPVQPMPQQHIEQNASAKTAKTKDSEGYYQEIIDTYKAYLAAVPDNIRTEIKDFRREIAKIQKRKRDVYKRLSNEAQAYLKHEEAFRKQLPIDKSELQIIDEKTMLDVNQTNSQAQDDGEPNKSR